MTDDLVNTQTRDIDKRVSRIEALELVLASRGNTFRSNQSFMWEGEEGYVDLIGYADSNAINVRFSRSKGTKAAQTAVTAGMDLGRMLGRGYDGSALIDSSRITLEVDSEGTVSSGVVPGAIGFDVANSAGTLTRRMTLASDGQLGLGTSTPNYVLHIQSSLVSTMLDSTGDNPAILYLRSARSTSGAAGYIRFQETNLSPQLDWLFAQHSTGYLYLQNYDQTTWKTSVVFEHGSPSNSFVLDSIGRVGLGESNPQYHIDITGNSTTGGTPIIRATSSSGDNYSMLYLNGYHSNTPAIIRMEDLNNNARWYIINARNFSNAYYIQSHDGTNSGNPVRFAMPNVNGRSRRLEIDADGTVFMGYNGDNTNSFLTSGLQINLGGYDGHALDIKSTDVAHGMTDLADTAVFLSMGKRDAGYGGGFIEGLSEYQEALVFTSSHTTDYTTAPTTAAVGSMVFSARKKNGTGVTTLGSTGIIAVFRNNSTTRVAMRADGTIYADVSWTTYDAHDDLALVRTLDQQLGDPILSKFDEWVGYNETDLVNLEILGAPKKDGGLLNITKLQQLHNGAIWQLANKVWRLAEEVERLGGDVKDILPEENQRGGLLQ